MYQQEGYDLMAAAFEVYNQLGYGMAEEIYQQSLEIELSLRDLLLARPGRLRRRRCGTQGRHGAVAGARGLTV